MKTIFDKISVHIGKIARWIMPVTFMVIIACSIVYFIYDYKKKEESMEYCNLISVVSTESIYSFDSAIIKEDIIQGRFLTVYGDYNGEICYSFNRLLEDGSKEIIRIPVKNSMIYNDEKDSPHVNIVTSSLCTSSVEDRVIKYEIYIPKDTIEIDYEGNLRNLK